MRSFNTQPRIPWPADGTLTVTSVRTNSSNVTTTIANGGFAAYSGETYEAEPSNGVFQYQDFKFTLALSAVSFQVKPFDQVTWQGTAFTVKTSNENYFLKFWDIAAIQLIIQPDLCDTIKIYRPTSTPTSDGLRTKTLSQVGSNIQGRLQPETMNVEQDTDGRMTRRQLANAYLGTAVVLQAGDLVQVSGVDWEVIEQSRQDEFKTFTRARVQRVL